MDELCMAYKKQHIDLRANSCTMKEERYSLTDIDDLCQSPLAKSLGSGHYVWIGEQASLGGKTAYSMFVLNISVWAIAYYCHKFRLPAFIYGELRGGSVHSEYWEKVDVSKLLCTKAERYRKREECEVKVAAAEWASGEIVGKCVDISVFLDQGSLAAGPPLKIDSERGMAEAGCAGIGKVVLEW